MGKRNPSTTTTVDPSTQSFLDQFRKRALGLADQGPNAELQDQFRGLAGNLDFANQRGLQGIEQFFNPFQDQVIGGLQQDFGRQRDLASTRAAQQATSAGAFGGDRSAILQAELLGGVNRNEANTLSGVRQQGFSNAANQLFGERNRAGQLGLAGLSGLQGLDQQQLQRLLALGGAIGPFGQTTTQDPGSGGAFQGGIGGAAAGSAFGPIGAGIGGGLGILGGLFG